MADYLPRSRIGLARKRRNLVYGECGSRMGRLGFHHYRTDTTPFFLLFVEVVVPEMGAAFVRRCVHQWLGVVEDRLRLPLAGHWLGAFGYAFVHHSVPLGLLCES